MWFFWLMCIVPALIGVVFLYFNKRVCWQEWLISVGTALLVAFIFQLIASRGMTDDIETWSGYGIQGKHYAAWQEYYEYAVYRTEYYTERESYTTTDSKGRSSTSYRTVTKSRQVFDHWEPTTCWHSDSWMFFTTLRNYEVSNEYYNYLTQKYNDNHAVTGTRTTWAHNSKMIGGDPNDYVADNRTGWIEPVITQKHFVNKVKAAPTLFSFVKVPTNIAVYPWPAVKNWNRSDRVMGTACNMIDTLKWDQMNAILGAAKKVNIIVVGFPSGSSEDMAKWQEAKWIGGKKNDLVISFAGGPEKPEWVTCFGWTESNVVKHNLEDLFLNNPINNDLIPKISAEVNANYTKKDWHKFDYITIEPPAWSYWVYLIVMILVQSGLFVWFHFNELDNAYYNKNVNFNDVEEKLLIRFKRKWQAFIAFFIKQPKPIQSPVMDTATELPIVAQRSYMNTRPQIRPLRRKTRKKLQ